MSGTWAVTERELRSSLRQPIAWIVTGAWLFVHALFFVQLMEEYSLQSFQLLASGGQAGELNLADRVLRPLLVGDSTVLLLLLPALTMRQLADEWRSGTSDLLMTYPLSEAQIVLGKFFASALLVTVMVALSGAYVLVAGAWGELELGVLLLGLLGLLLYGWSVLAIGLAMSALTDNQVIAFASTLMVLLLLTLLGFWGARVEPPWSSILLHLNFTGHVGHFGFGVWRLSSTLFFLSLSVFFLYVATGLLGRRRWSSRS